MAPSARLALLWLRRGGIAGQLRHERVDSALHVGTDAVSTSLGVGLIGPQVMDLCSKEILELLSGFQLTGDTPTASGARGLGCRALRPGPLELFSERASMALKLGLALVMRGRKLGDTPGVSLHRNVSRMSGGYHLRMSTL